MIKYPLDLPGNEIGFELIQRLGSNSKQQKTTLLQDEYSLNLQRKKKRIMFY